MSLKHMLAPVVVLALVTDTASSDNRRRRSGFVRSASTSSPDPPDPPDPPEQLGLGMDINGSFTGFRVVNGPPLLLLLGVSEGGEVNGSDINATPIGGSL